MNLLLLAVRVCGAVCRAKNTVNVALLAVESAGAFRDVHLLLIGCVFRVVFWILKVLAQTNSSSALVALPAALAARGYDGVRTLVVFETRVWLAAVADQ